MNHDDPVYLKKRATQLLEVAKTMSDPKAIEVLEGVANELWARAVRLPKEPGNPASDGKDQPA